jgi:hypothetical protein
MALGSNILPGPGILRRSWEAGRLRGREAGKLGGWEAQKCEDPRESFDVIF